MQVGDCVFVSNVKDNQISIDCIGKIGIIVSLSNTSSYPYKVRFGDTTDTFKPYNLEKLFGIGDKVIYNNNIYKVTGVSEDKRYYLIKNNTHEELISPENLIKLESIDKKQRNKIKPRLPKKFKLRQIYSLDNQVYQCIQIVRSINDVPFHSLVMKNMSNNFGVMCLTKEDCKILHVRYEPGLELMSSFLKWQKL